MSQRFRGRGGHHIFLIGTKNTNLVENVEVLLPLKCLGISFSGFRGEVKMSQSIAAKRRRLSLFRSDKTKWHKSATILCNSLKIAPPPPKKKKKKKLKKIALSVRDPEASPQSGGRDACGNLHWISQVGVGEGWGLSRNIFGKKWMQMYTFRVFYTIAGSVYFSPKYVFT